MKKLLGERVMVIPDNSDEEKTAGGIIIPKAAETIQNNMKSGIIAKKGTGTPWNRMDDLHLKDRVIFKRESGIPYEEEADGHIAKYLILSYDELLFEE